MQLATSKGPARWVWVEIEAEHDPEGEVRQWRMTLADISVKKEAETALRISENRYRSLFAAMVSGALVFEVAKKDRAGKVTDIRFMEMNAAFEKLTGYNRDQLMGKTLMQIWPDTEQFWLDQVDHALHKGQSLEVEGFHRTLQKHFLFSVFRLDNHRFGATFSDISARVSVEKALEKTRQTLEIKVRDRTAEVQDADTALRVLLKQNEKARQRLEEKIICNLNTMTRAHLDRLAASNLSRRQRKLG